MKKIVCLIFVSCILILCKAQGLEATIQLKITANKTTSLIFPFAIKHIDRGTNDVLVQRVDEADNLLFVKASVPGFMETNLSVVTADGHLYSFTVIYDSDPPSLVYRLAAPQNNEAVAFKNETLNEVQVQEYAKSILDNKKSIGGIRSRKWEMTAKVIGIYIKDNVIFYQFLLRNESLIGYDIDFIRFYIRDKKKSKRTASQEVELKPLCTVGNVEVVNGNGANHFVVVLDKFTIPDAKFLAIEIMEKNGGRHLLLKVKNNKIIKATSLGNFK